MAAILSIIIAIVLAITAGLAHIPAVRQFALEWGGEKLAAEQGLELKADKLNYNLFTLKSSLTNVSLRAANQPDLPPLLTADRVEIDLSLLALAAGRLEIESGRVTGGRLQVVYTEDGRSNLPPSDGGGGGAPDILIRSFEGTGPLLRYSDRGPPLETELRDWRLRVDGNDRREHRIRFETASAGVFRFEERETAISRINIDLGGSATAAQLRSAELLLGETQVSLDGGIGNPFDPTLDLTVRVEGLAADLAQIAGVEAPVNGAVRVDARVRNKPAEIEIETKVHGEGLTYENLAPGNADLAFTWAMGDERLDMNSLAVDAPWAQLSGSGSAALTEEAGETRVSLEYSRVDLDALSRLADVEVRPAARAAGRLEARFPGLEWARADGEGLVRLTASRQEPSRNMLPLSGSANFRRRGDRMQADLRDLRTLGLQASGPVAISGDAQRLEGALRIEAADSGEVVRRADLFLGSAEGESLVPTTVAGPLGGTVQLAGTVEDPQATLALEGQGLTVGEIEGVRVALDAAASRQEVAIEALTVDWLEQRFEAGGRVGFSGETTTLDLTAGTTDAQIADLLRGLQNDTPASGLFSMSARIGGTADDPEVDFSATATELVAYAEPFGTLEAAGAYGQGRLEASLLRLEKPTGRGGVGVVQGTGFVDFDDDRIGLNLGGDDLELAGLELPSGETLTGKLSLRAVGDGTYSDPQVQVTLNGRELQLDERALGELAARLQLAGQRATVEARAPKWNAVLTGATSLEEPRRTTAAVVLSGLDLAELEVDVREGERLTGTIDGRVEASGLWGEWEDFTAQAQLSALEMAAAGQRIASEGPIRARYADRRLALEPAVLVSGDSRLEVEGELPLAQGGAPGEVLLSGGVDLGPLPAILGLTPEDAFAEGVLMVDGSVRGSLDRPEPRLDLRMDSGIVFLPQTVLPLIGIQLDASVEPESVTLRSFESDWGSARVSAQGTAATAFFLDDAPADGAPRTEFRASISGLNLAMEAMPDGVSGLLSAKIEGSAATPTLEALRAVIRVQELEAAYQDLRLRQAEQSEIQVRNGVAQIASLRLTGPGTDLEASGSVGITGERPLDLRLAGTGDAAILTLIDESLVAGGAFELEATARGTAADPQLEGYLRMNDGRFAVDDPRVNIAGLALDLRFDGERVEIATLTGELNGGTMTASGGFGYEGAEIRDIDVSLSASDLFMDVPEGLRTLSSANLELTSTQDGLVTLGGNVEIEDGSMRERLDIQSQVLEFLGDDGGLDLAEERNPFLSRLRYNVNVDSLNPILIDNNLARLEVNVDLRVAGSYYRPALLGNVTFEEGGEVYLAENEYVVETGRIQFTNETRIEPSLNLTARTSVAGHEITLQATGDSEDLETQFTSDSGLSEPDIISLLLTGRTLEDAQESGFNVARDQALSYLTGRLGGQISRAAEESLGLSRVRIEPNLISAEDDPSARLTVGQNLTRKLELIYSMNLTDSSDQIFVAEYDVTRMFTTRGVKQEDNSYRFDFRHDLRFGLGDQRRATRKPGPSERVGEVRLTGDPRIAEEVVRDVFDVKPDDKYEFFRTRNRVDKLSREYRDRNRLESRIRLRRTKSEGVVDLELEIDGGPQVELIYEGGNPPGGVQGRVEDAWVRGVFEEQRLSDAVDALTVWLDDEKYYASEIRTEVQELGPDEKRILFEIYRGAEFSSLEPVFRGAEGISAEQLEDILDRANLRERLRSEPAEVAETLQRYYLQEGYLAAEVEEPALELNEESGEARAVIVIEEGRLFHVGSLSYSGNKAISEEDLRKATTPAEPRPYTPEYLEESIENVEQLYWERGYNDVQVDFRLTRAPADAKVDITFEITEAEKDVVEEIQVTGNRHVGDKLIKRRMASSIGDPLISENNARSRRRLYDTGAFSLVDFDSEDLSEDRTDGLNPVRLIANIREVSPYKLRYGAFFDTERGPGVITDFENRNSLGSARVVGLRARYDQDFREARAYFGQPLLLGLPINSSVTTYRSREIDRTVVDGEETGAFITDRTGVTLQQEIQFNRRWILNYGYRYERARVFDRDPDPFFPFDVTVNVAPVLSTLSYDSRDELLDATRGQFFSHGIEFAPTMLGSSVPLIKYFGQYFRYQSFFRPEATPFDRKVPRPRLTWASGVRIGLMDGLGDTEVVPRSERFFAGGGTTLRGFEQDRVGPIDFDGAPLGGEAVFLINEEARFPIIGPFEGVGFMDIGNVYEKFEDFDITDLRKTAGVGLRVRTPFFLLRVDYGVKLDRREGESSGEIFFSIGQAF